MKNLSKLATNEVKRLHNNVTATFCANNLKISAEDKTHFRVTLYETASEIHSIHFTYRYVPVGKHQLTKEMVISKFEVTAKTKGKTDTVLLTGKDSRMTEDIFHACENVGYPDDGELSFLESYDEEFA